MIFALILVGLILVLLTGVPVFAGLTLFSVALLYIVEGRLGGVGDLVFGHLDSYLLVAIPWEERSLRRIFGEPYARYQQAVRWRVVPYVY